MTGHESSLPQSESWLTPPAIIEALGGWESFDLDPCGYPGQHEHMPTARAYYTEADNGLLLPWHGRVWLNPPYTRHLVGRFLGRMAAHGHGTALIFARTENDAFQRFVWRYATGILFIAGRLTFHRPDGSLGNFNGGAPSVLVAYGEDDMDILAAAPINGAFVPLRLRVHHLVKAFAADSTWAEALDSYMRANSGPVELSELYRAFSDHPKTRRNQHWREKLRQALQRGAYERVDRGVWRRARPKRERTMTAAESPG
jgi:hypothetical protein